MILTALIAISLQVFQVNQSMIATVPDFSGTWRIDRKLSTYEHLQDLDDLTFVISQNESTINVKRIIKEKKHKERVSELTYYADGRGEKVFSIRQSKMELKNELGEWFPCIEVHGDAVRIFNPRFLLLGLQGNVVAVEGWKSTNHYNGDNRSQHSELSAQSDHIQIISKGLSTNRLS